VINAAEDDSDGTVTVTTSDVEDGQMVTVTLGAKSYTGTVSSGSAAITIPAADLQALTEGDTYSLTANVSDAAGNAAVQDSSTSFTVDKVAPTIETVSTSWGSVINAAEVDNDGTVTITTNGAEDGQAVTVTLNSQNYTGTVSSGSAKITIPAEAGLKVLTNGDTYNLTADVSDAAGNAAVQNDATSFNVDLTALPLPRISAVDTSSGLSGAAEAGASVSVVMTDPSGTDTSLSTTADATTGAWNFTSADILGTVVNSDDNGSYAFSMTATDATGNISEVVEANLTVVEAPEVDIVGGLNIVIIPLLPDEPVTDVVTYGLIADGSYDLDGGGIGALDFAINFDITNFDWVDGSLTSDYDGWMMVLPNETEASGGVVQGGFIALQPYTDFSNPIAEFQMTTLETSEPVAISIIGTNFDSATPPDTLIAFDFV
jgi:hypothetical protein